MPGRESLESLTQGRSSMGFESLPLGLRAGLAEAVDAARYSRLENVLALTELPCKSLTGVELRAELFGCTPEELMQIDAGLESIVQVAGTELLADAEFRAAVDRLRVAPGDVVVTIGDSITADRLSWAEILGQVLVARLATVELANLAVSGGTSADMLGRISAVIDRAPDWVIMMIGTNDARRHGPGGDARMVSTSETLRNVEQFVAVVTEQTAARVTLLTPPPIDEQQAIGCKRFSDAQISWRADDVAELAALLLERHPNAIDLHSRRPGYAIDELLGPDGVHPTALGQRELAGALVAQLSR